MRKIKTATETRFDRSRFPEAGFTLIEIMIVLAIMAGLLFAGAKIFNSSAEKRTTVRRLAIMTREVRSMARLSQATMRIVINQDDEKGHSYWVESAPGNVTLVSQERQKELDQLTHSQRDDEAPKSEFSLDSRVLKKPERLPRGLFFDGVEFSGRPEAVKGRAAYIHFFPQGLAENALIHLSDRKTLHWTIQINPLTGRAQVFERDIALKELERK